MVDSGHPVTPVSKPFVWSSADGLADGWISVEPPDGPYPPMVKLYVEGPGGDSFEFTMIDRDATDLAACLSAAAAFAHPRFFREKVDG